MVCQSVSQSVLSVLWLLLSVCQSVLFIYGCQYYSFTVLFSLIGFYSGGISLLINTLIGVAVFTLFFSNNARLGVFIGFVSESILGLIFYQLSSKKILNKHPWLLLLFAIFVQILSFLSTSNYLLLDNIGWFNVLLFNSVSTLTLYIFTLVEFHKWNSITDSRFRQVEENYNFLLERVSGGFYRDWETDRKSTRLNSSHRSLSRMPSSA